MCNECGNSLELQFADIDNRGNIDLKVSPCESCLEKEYDRGLEDQID